MLVNQYLPYVEVWQRNEDQPENPKAWLNRHYSSGEAVELISIDIRIPMEEIYLDVDFAEEDEEELI